MDTKQRVAIVAGRHVPIFPDVVQYRLQDGTIVNHRPTPPSLPMPEEERRRRYGGFPSSVRYTTIVHDLPRYEALQRSGALLEPREPALTDNRIR